MASNFLVWKMWQAPFSGTDLKKRNPGLPRERTVSLFDCVGVALVDTCTAVDAFGLVDDCDVVDGDSVLRANVSACSACNTVVSDDLRHDFHL